MKIDIIATAAFGLESVVARELMLMGYENTRTDNGRVSFSADVSAIARTNLWLRSADRVLLEIGSFPASTFDELFEATKALSWADWLSEDAEFPVTARSVKSRLHSVPDCQSIVKKAVVESMKTRYALSHFPETGPRFAIHCSLLNDVATITLDTSGQGLHKRGYRKTAGIAPLRETLAAGMLQLSRWAPHRMLVDPFCGSGTIPIEAAMMGCNIAPGALRTFVAQDWPWIPKSVWDDARAEALDLQTHSCAPEIFGSDIDEDAIALSLQHAKAAGVSQHVRFEQKAVKDLEVKKDYGCIVCNPPYGERAGSVQEAEQAYRDLRWATSHLDTWSLFVLTAYKRFESIIGRRAQKRRRLYNATIECVYYQYLGPLPPRTPSPD